MSKLNQGFIHIYTGNGKGKSTAAIGQAVRAAGFGLKTYIVQFMKEYPYNELNSLKYLGEWITIEQFGGDAFVYKKELPGKEEISKALKGLSIAKEKTFSVSSKVTFDPLTSEEIGFYINNYHPYDKAGAYGIQEWIGLAACSSIEGSYFNVVGLPVRTLYRELQEFICPPTI